MPECVDEFSPGMNWAVGHDGFEFFGHVAGRAITHQNRIFVFSLALPSVPIGVRQH
jgi:hypothetical protein